MAPAHNPVFLSQKSSTKDGIIRHICNFILSVAEMYELLVVQAGDDCTTPLCPNGCSGLGMCNAATGLCTCHHRRTGADCLLFSCPAVRPHAILHTKHYTIRDLCNVSLLFTALYTKKCSYYLLLYMQCAGLLRGRPVRWHDRRVAG